MNHSQMNPETREAAYPLPVSSEQAAGPSRERAFSSNLESFFERINRSSVENEYLEVRVLNVPSAGRDLFAEDDAGE